MMIFMKGLLIFIAIIAAPVIWYKIAYPTYSWNQKLTVEVQTPSGVVSGSSVTSIEWSRNFFSGGWGGLHGTQKYREKLSLLVLGEGDISLRFCAMAAIMNIPQT